MLIKQFINHTYITPLFYNKYLKKLNSENKPELIFSTGNIQTGHMYSVS